MAPPVTFSDLACPFSDTIQVRQSANERQKKSRQNYRVQKQPNTKCHQLNSKIPCGSRKGAAPNGSSEAAAAAAASDALITRLSLLFTFTIPGKNVICQRKEIQSRAVRRFNAVANFLSQLLLWEPRRILSNSAPNKWSSFNWLKGEGSSKGFQTATCPTKDVPSGGAIVQPGLLPNESPVTWVGGTKDFRNWLVSSA